MVEALGAGDVKKAISLFEPHYAEKLSLAGTPEEVVEKIKADLEPAGVNHMILSFADPFLVKLFSGEEVAERAGHPGPAQARRRAGDAGVRVRRITAPPD